MRGCTRSVSRKDPPSRSLTSRRLKSSRPVKSSRPPAGLAMRRDRVGTVRRKVRVWAGADASARRPYQTRGRGGDCAPYRGWCAYRWLPDEKPVLRGSPRLPRRVWLFAASQDFRLRGLETCRRSAGRAQEGNEQAGEPADEEGDQAADDAIPQERGVAVEANRDNGSDARGPADDSAPRGGLPGVLGCRWGSRTASAVSDAG